MDPLPLIALKALVGNDIPRLNAFQELLFPQLTLLVTLWWFVWFVTLIVIIRYVLAHGRSTENEHRDH